MGGVAEAVEFAVYAVAVGGEFWVEESADVFEHDGSGVELCDELEGAGEEVAFVFAAELLACFAEWWAGHAAGEEVGAWQAGWVPVEEVRFDDVPVGAVVPQGGAGVGVDFDDCGVFEASLFEAEGLTACSGADLDGC